MYFLTGSSRLSFPSCCSSTSAVAVNCFATEPDSKIVCVVFGTSCSRSASPNAFSKTTSPLSDTAAAQPGAGPTYALVALSNARAAPATTFSFSGTCAEVAVERNAITVKTNKKFFLVIEVSKIDLRFRERSFRIRRGPMPSYRRYIEQTLDAGRGRFIIPRSFLALPQECNYGSDAVSNLRRRRWLIRRRRSLIGAQGSSIARTLGTSQEISPTLKGFGSWRTLSAFPSYFNREPRVVATLQPLG